MARKLRHSVFGIVLFFRLSCPTVSKILIDSDPHYRSRHKTRANIDHYLPIACAPTNF
jgi:hypothetical protein